MQPSPSGSLPCLHVSRLFQSKLGHGVLTVSVITQYLNIFYKTISLYRLTDNDGWDLKRVPSEFAYFAQGATLTPFYQVAPLKNEQARRAIVSLLLPLSWQLCLRRFHNKTRMIAQCYVSNSGLGRLVSSMLRRTSGWEEVGKQYAEDD